jgi:(p)ppGpp synthase/HD superfamily hydrolase
MASREYAKPPARRSPELEQAVGQWPIVARADSIAAVAHGAIGQRRADRITPYIDHPRRAAALILQWQAGGIVDLDEGPLQQCVACALLHDVLEDTKLPRSELREQIGADPRLFQLVEIMTELPGDPDAPEYYRRIGRDADAIIVKCADRCANLDDVIADVKRGESLDRWRRYAHKTQRDVLPILRDPKLERELMRRIEAIEEVLGAPSR